MTLSDNIYPHYAKNIPAMLTHLFYKGNPIPMVNCSGTAIIGTRRCSREAKAMAVKESIRLSNESVPVISGMAKGIDSYAHTACLQSHGYTIAVLGNGLDICYPSEHKKLMDAIEQQGLLLSEYEPGVHPIRQYFPLRNRIIAALAKKIIIIQAGERSGARITAKYGEEYGKKVRFL